MAELFDHPVKSAEYDGKDLEALSVLRRYRAWMMGHFGAYLKGDVVEIGAGVGNMSEHLQPYASNLVLVEPSLNLIEHLTKRFGNTEDVSISHRSFETFVASTPEKSYDSVVMVNVLEHIEDDRMALSQCFRILRPGGHLLILVPALQFLYSDMDKSVGHFRRYERADLENKIQTADFFLQDLRYFDAIGIIPWLLFNTLGGATEFNPKLMGLYDKIFVPVSRTIETIVRPPIGKNLIGIFRRPA